MKYTPVRRFYAIVGFTTILVVFGYLIATYIGYVSVGF